MKVILVSLAVKNLYPGVYLTLLMASFLLASLYGIRPTARVETKSEQTTQSAPATAKVPGIVSVNFSSCISS